jgi:hypothetical protein
MRVWSVVVVLTTLCFVFAACGSTASHSTFTTHDAGGSDVTLPPPGTLSDGGGCVPKTCAQMNYSCGVNADGCGNTINCGTCISPAFCGGGGFSQCGGNAALADGGSLCMPQSCSSLGYNCGPASDGCGNLLNCGTCTAPAFCGGGGFSQCGGNSAVVDAGGNVCVPKTCAQQGLGCGPAGDGCGNQISCGTCMAPEFCGGGGFSQCGGDSAALDGGGGVCTPTTCTTLGFNCGFAGDGCGNMLNCGTCTAPQFCGAGGFNVCGGNSVVAEGGSACVPQTCAQLGFDCGPADDGCGNQLNCGSCQSPQICGGGGFPGVCGDSACTGLCLNQVQCDGGVTTTFTGTVVGGTQAPYGSPDPVPNVVVYVPNGTVQPFTAGVQCSQCGADVSGNPLVQTTTNYLGQFTLQNVPVPPSGNVPLVIQLGRWRRQLSFPVTACQTTNIGQITMPREQSATDNIPLTAISTGAYDAMECVLVKMGVNVNQFSAPGAGGRIQMFQGNGVDVGLGTLPETSLVDPGTSVLDDYDQVLFPCWGEDPRPGSPDSDSENEKTPTQQGNVIQYTTNGGRVFATHYSYSWLYDDNPFEGTATWVPDSEPATATANIQTSPADVNIMYMWMNALTANGATNGQFTMQQPRYNLSAVNTNEAELWINATNPQGPYQYPMNDAGTGEGPAPASFPVLYTFNTPVGSANQCGKVVFSSFHVTVVTAASGNTIGQTFPEECPMAPMSPQEKALEYLIWDLASCVPGPPAPPTCTPLTCAQQNIGCGPAGDGCGNMLNCGPCTPPQTCGGGGVPDQCGSTDGGSCTPQTCAQQNIGCGPAGDGCGNMLDCGPCTPPQTCGGGGVPNQCGFIDGGSCMPKTCQQQNVQCGPAPDGCGHLLQCGPCTAPQVCGGAGQAGVCGLADGGSCVPETCQQQSIQCGPAGDGCGNVIQCGPCTPPQTCGGAGQLGMCGYIDGGSCTPQTCQGLGQTCGPAGDGCGNLLQCGTCTPPETCGGGGMPGVCGGGTK